MTNKEVTVSNEIGLHARPATYFIKKANEYRSDIWIECETKRVSGKSLLGILSLGIMGGMKINILADGPDEKDAVSGLEELLMSLKDND